MCLIFYKDKVIFFWRNDNFVHKYYMLLTGYNYRGHISLWFALAAPIYKIDSFLPNDPFQYPLKSSGIIQV